MAREPETTPATTHPTGTTRPGFKTEVTDARDAPSVSDRTKAEQEAGVAAAQAQGQSLQRASHDLEHVDDVDTYVEPAPLNSEADVTDIGRIAEEMNERHYEEDQRAARRSLPRGLNPGEVASRGFSPTGHPATGTYPDNAPVSDDKRFPQDKQGQKAAATKAEREKAKE